MKSFTQHINENKNWSIENDELIFDENRKIVETIPVMMSKVHKTYVGYWASALGTKYQQIWYGSPEPNWDGWNDKELYDTFLSKLYKKMDKARKAYAKGWSQCRICGCRNGSVEYDMDEKKVGDNEYSVTVMPEGYIHYIKEHKIKPHKRLLEYIINS